MACLVGSSVVAVVVGGPCVLSVVVVVVMSVCLVIAGILFVFDDFGGF